MSNLILPTSLPVLSQSPLECSGALGLQPCLEPVKLPALGITSPQPTDDSYQLEPVSRCAVKGCVFPASTAGSAECRYHTLLRSEAVLFQSHQPSHMLLLFAPLDIPEAPIVDSRQQDRKRLAVEREEFIMDEPV